MIAIEPALQIQLERVAQNLERPIEEMTNEAIRDYLQRLNQQKLDAEMKSFVQMHPELKKRYYKQFVAVHNGQVIDSGSDFESLFLRVKAKLGDIAVLISQVSDGQLEEWKFRSPRTEYN